MSGNGGFLTKTHAETTLLAQIPNLDESRKAYKAFGKDPGRFRVSSEALYRRVRQGKDLYRINTVVDANNHVAGNRLSLGP